MTDYYVDGTYSIAGSVTSGSFISGETMVQTDTLAVAIYGSGTGPIVVGYQTYPVAAVDNKTWVGRSSGAVFTPTGTPQANGSNSNNGSIGTPWATVTYALSQLSGDQHGNSIKVKRNSVLWESVGVASWGTGEGADRFAIEDYGSGNKPMFLGSINIPSGSLWTLAPGKTYTYRTPFDHTKYGITATWGEWNTGNASNGQVIYDHVHGSYAWFGYYGLPYKSGYPNSRRPVRQTSEVTVANGGSGYPASSTTVYLQLDYADSPSNNRTAVLKCTTDGNGVITAVNAITCPGCTYPNGTHGTIMHPYLNSTIQGSGCAITFTSSTGDQTLADILTTVDFWPGSCFYSADYLYMHTMHTPPGWSNFPYAADTNGVNLTVAGHDYWATVINAGIYPSSASVQYVDYKSLSSWRNAGPPFNFANNDGELAMLHCRLFDFEAHHPLGDCVDIYGQYNEIHNLQIWFEVEFGLLVFQDNNEVSRKAAYNSVDGLIIHSTVSDDADRHNYNPQWTPIGQLVAVEFQTPVSVNGVESNILNNIIVNGNCQSALVMTSPRPQYMKGNIIRNFKFNGIASAGMIKSINTEDTVVDRFDNSGYPHNIAIDDGVIFNGCASPTLTRCKLYASAGNTKFMKLANNSGTINVTNNLFAGTSATRAADVAAIYAINMQVGQLLNVNNNTFDNWYLAIYCEQDLPFNFHNNLLAHLDFVYTAGGVTNYSGDNNCLFSCDYWGWYVSLSEWQAAHPTYDVSTFIASAQPYETNTYRLIQAIAAASSCVGKGVAGEGGVTYDFNWLKIPNGGKVDIGAFQIQRNW